MLYPRYPEMGVSKLTFLLLQHVEEWHSVICAITSNKENVTVAAEISLGHTKQVPLKFCRLGHPTLGPLL